MKTEQELIAKAVVDSDFRKRLLADPEGVVASDGYEISAGTLKELKKTIAMTPEAVNAAIEAAVRDGGAGT
jgi:hypothetical protein